MQQKVNSVTVQLGSEEKTYEDVIILKGSEGLYIETQEKIGTDNEGNDLLQAKLTMFPWGACPFYGLDREDPHRDR